MVSDDRTPKYIVYTDGGSRGNPGPAAIGVIIKDAKGHMVKSYGDAIGTATNNQAEYRAVISALQKLKSLLGGKRSQETTVDAFMDSELVARQLNDEYKIAEESLFPLFIKVHNLKLDFKKVSFQHVPREKNREADKLVNQALDANNGKLF